jgi:hypothetical protein
MKKIKIFVAFDSFCILNHLSFAIIHDDKDIPLANEFLQNPVTQTSEKVIQFLIILNKLLSHFN